MECVKIGDKLICKYDSKEEREEHIIKMCSDSKQTVHIYGNDNNLRADFKEEM